MTTINPNLQLSEHFVLREFIHSVTAQRLHIDNTPGLCHVSRLIALCEHVLEPLRKVFGPIIINSGYRCPALNRAVGGAANSQHLRGEAADVRTTSLQQAQQMYDFVRRHLVYDQVILEHARRTGSVWLHVSYRKDELANRRHGLHLTLTKNMSDVAPTAAEPHLLTAMVENTPTAAADTPLTAVMRCRYCGEMRNATQFAMLPSGNRRRMCNRCRWQQHIMPSRHRQIIRELSETVSS